MYMETYTVYYGNHVLPTIEHQSIDIIALNQNVGFYANVADIINESAKGS